MPGACQEGPLYSIPSCVEHVVPAWAPQGFTFLHLQGEPGKDLLMSSAQGVPSCQELWSGVELLRESNGFCGLCLQEKYVEELAAVRQTLQADLETSIRRIADLQAALEEVASSDSDTER